MPQSRDLTIKAIARRASFITEVKSIVSRCHPGQHASHALRRGVEFAQKSDLAVPAGIGHSHRVAKLGNIDPDKRFSIISHGSPSCVRIGSATPSNPR
jgi:hypothetical protein